MSDDHVKPSPYVAGLPFGQDLPLPETVEWDVFPFEGEMTVRPLQQPVLPEPPRHGEDGPESCDDCARADDTYLWTDEHWRLSSLREPTGLPGVVMLWPRAHHDLGDLPVERAAELGVMIQRVERALLALGGIARAHVGRWGDGAAHLHLWLFARPEGMLQLRGNCMTLWDDVLPPLPEADWLANNKVIAAAMAEGGGIAHV
ncbi:MULTISPECIES: hypothetical protein [unclassified Kitasatospora]|uniref:hypothetical protein n=1 Tax=unclassified Kitasatospora TaxID=2633591 RepID=UPI000A90A54B|nr:MULTISPECIES: hypothetical protein [unclassified Kitasatospora]